MSLPLAKLSAASRLASWHRRCRCPCRRSSSSPSALLSHHSSPVAIGLVVLELALLPTPALGPSLPGPAPDLALGLGVAVVEVVK